MSMATDPIGEIPKLQERIATLEAILNACDSKRMVDEVEATTRIYDLMGELQRAEAENAALRAELIEDKHVIHDYEISVPVTTIASLNEEVAALRAANKLLLNAAFIPEGMCLVPREPTPHFLYKMQYGEFKLSHPKARKLYKAMIAAYEGEGK